MGAVMTWSIQSTWLRMWLTGGHNRYGTCHQCRPSFPPKRLVHRVARKLGAKRLPHALGLQRALCLTLRALGCGRTPCICRRVTRCASAEIARLLHRQLQRDLTRQLDHGTTRIRPAAPGPAGRPRARPASRRRSTCKTDSSRKPPLPQAAERQRRLAGRRLVGPAAAHYTLQA